MTDILSLPEFTIIEPSQENESDMLFKVETKDPPILCPECGFNKLYKHGSRKHLVMDLPIRTKRVGLQINRNRYRCLNCGSTFWERLNSVSNKRKMTKRLETFIQDESLKKTFVEVAEMVGVDEKTVRNIFNEYVAIKEEEHTFSTPKWLGIDELYIIKKPRLVMTNIEQRTIYDVRQNRNKETVVARLMAIPDRYKIQYITMDMWNPYRDAVHECLPDACIIVDKFHVVRMANNAVETVRKSIRKNVSTKERRALMHDRKILLKRNHELDEMGKILLQTWLDQYPELKQAYDLKESFYGIWDAETPDDGSYRFSKWLAKLSESIVKDAFKDLAKAVNNWRTEIFTYFDKRLTNAYTESFNNIIRTINRAGRGYSFDVLRAKLLFNEQLHKSRKPRFDSSAFMDVFSSYNSNWFDVTDNDYGENYGVDFSTLIKYLEED